MSNKHDLVAFLKQVWGGIVGFIGAVLAIIGYIKRFGEEDLGLLTLILLIVGVACLYLSCFYYLFLWEPKKIDSSGAYTHPGSDRDRQNRRLQIDQKKKEKIIRRIALIGFFVISILTFSGVRLYQDKVQQAPTNFKILVANFTSSNSSNLGVTQQIFSNLQTEMRDYGDDVVVEKLGKSLGSIQEAKQVGKKKKATVVIWGDYQVTKKIVPIRVNFEILHKANDYINLEKSLQGTTQTAQISELETFQLQMNLSKEMTYLSLFTLGMYRYLDNDWQQAIQYLKKALAISQETDQPINSLRREVIYFYIGTSANNLEAYDISLKYFDRAVQINPDLDEAWSNRGFLLNNLGEYEEAITSHNKAIKINPNSDKAWNNRGLTLNNLGEYEEAITSYNKAIKINPNSDKAWNNRGATLSELGNHEEAIASYDKAIEINPNLDAVWNNRGVTLHNIGEYKEAITSYNKAIKINPNLSEALYGRGNALYNIDEYKEAITSYDKAIKINPNDNTAWHNRGDALHNIGEHGEAITSYDKAIKINPNDNTAWHNRGLSLSKIGEYEEAITSYDKAIKINPDHDAAWNNCGNALGNLGRYEKAIASYDEAIKINPGYDVAWNNRGNALSILGRYKLAISSYDEAISINPNNAMAKKNRNFVLTKLSK